MPLWLNAFFTLLAVAVLVFAPVWIWQGLTWSLVATLAALLLLLAWNAWHLYRLLRWLKGPMDAPLPHGGGIWDQVFAGLHRRVRIRAEQQQALARSLDRFRQAGEALPDGVIILNRHHQIEGMNAKAAELVGLDPQADLGQAVTNLVRHPDFVNYLVAARFEEPLTYRSERYAGHTLLFQVVPYGMDQLLLLVRDISQLERLETMRRDFVANVSHELKTPLTVVNGFIETLDALYEQLGPDEARRFLGLAHEQSQRMQHLIADLLTLSALETGSPKPPEDRIEVSTLIDSLLSDAEVLSAGRHQLSTRCQGPSYVLAAPGELRSAFANLVTNAIRYTPEGGSIEIIWEARPQGGAVFAVQDTGIGIAAEHLPRLTERFYRVDRSRSRETGGTGLGLAIVKHVATRHQAQLEVRSEPGKGSRFSVVFPPARVA